MPQKIFISYRRQDSGANALGIGQYLEHEFGRKNVFIDVDMRAGSKFPAVLEQRLAECKVMLVLIGPEWLNARDEQGQRRLDDPNDWVRLEIAHALKRDITVIPVRVNGAELPLKATLPEDIRGLLDHQAVSVTLAGFRNEMSGLARDIRSISSTRRWGRSVVVAAGACLGLVIFALYQASWLSNALDHIRHFPLAQVFSGGANQNGIWSSTPGEWVMFGVGNKAIAYYFKPSSVKIFGDKVVYTARYPLAKVNPPEGGYQEDVTVVDCKKSIWAMSRQKTYNKSGVVVADHKWADPELLDLSIGGPIRPGTIVSSAEQIMCDESLRTPLLSKGQLAKMNLSYLGRTARGDGQILYGSIKETSHSSYGTELLFVVKLDEDHKFAEVFPNQTIVGLPPDFRVEVDRLQTDCTARKLLLSKSQYLDSEDNLLYLSAPQTEPLAPPQTSPFGWLLATVCGASITGVEEVRGTYEGMADMTYKSGRGRRTENLDHYRAECECGECELQNCDRCPRQRDRDAQGCCN